MIRNSHLPDAGTAPARRNRTLPLLALALGLVAAGPALAAGGGGGGGGSGNEMNACPKGQTWSSAKRQCIVALKGTLPDEDVAQYAYVLAKAQRYEEALATLDLLQDPNTARALNYRGYVTRKLGRVDEGIRYYLMSVSLDPHYAQVREYLGEAYVTQGKLDLAREQLDAIKGICGTGCEEYEDLAEAIRSPANL